jgi:hypothetical protein
MGSLIVPDKYKNPAVKEVDVTGNENVRLPDGYISYNQELQRLAIQKETEAQEEYEKSLLAYDSSELPLLPVEGEPVTQGTNRDSKLQETLEGLKHFATPITNPVLEVMNAVNSGIYGTAWDMVVAIPQIGIGAYNKATTGEFDYPSAPKPEAITNQTYVANPDDAEILDKAALYINLGVGMNMAARTYTNKLGQNFAKEFAIKEVGTGNALKIVPSRPFMGIEGARRGVVRDIASTPMSTEVGIGLSMAGASAIGKAQDIKILGVDVVTLPLELIAGVTAAATLATRTAAPVLNAFEKKFGQSPVFVASKKIRGESVSPSEAKQALEASSAEEVLSVAVRTEDSGILTLERSLAATDSTFRARVDEGVDLAQASLADELSKLTDPVTGSYNWEAFKEILPKIQQDFRSQVDDRVTAAKDQLDFIVRAFENDPVKASKEFTKAFDNLMSDLTVQEQRLWQPINDLVKVPTHSLRQDILAIVQGANKAQNLPVAEMSEILGVGVARTNKGWKITTNKKEATQPKVRLLTEEAPIVLTTMRSNLNQIRRAAARTTDSKDRFDQDILFKMQEAILKSLTNNADTVNPELKASYEAAIKYTKEMHEVTSNASLIPTIRKAQPEKKAAVLLGGKDQADIAVAARELKELFGVIAKDSPAASSRLLKHSEQYLMNKFANQVDPEDLASFDLFIAKHQDWFKRFPNALVLIKAARQKAKDQGVIVENALKAQEAAKAREFYAISGKSPEAAMDIILNAANPTQVASQFKKLLSKSPTALQEFKDQIARRIAAESMSVVDRQIAGAGKQQVIQAVPFEVALKKYRPLTNVFNTKGLKGLELLHKKSMSLARSIQAGKGSEQVEGKGTSLAVILLAKVVALKAVSALAGSQSIVLANSASNIATKAVRGLTDDVANDVLKEAYKNEELMKILLSENITNSQLAVLNSNKFQSGRTLFKALTEGISQEPQE